ncbi:hypothetical protein QBC46DRAFT_262899 [Diplogelasinospora grovesii]|uniref:FAD-binding PCMH-type domain-containing protein n=1 Tax=Diplogelasinospora grovesii TaxID=303347 RepID=A0AAN6S3X0_9PEZI|nr:hypothetical protein QBC46DRAFT_262899 [Diplogelasinospora grovesii]
MRGFLLSAGLFAAGVLAGQSCKCFPGASCWPSTGDWNQLNRTVGGRLIATVPLAEACHDPNYDAEECQYLQGQWQYPGIHMNNSASVMAPFFANQSCDPFTAESKPCTLGNYVRYAVDVRTPGDVAAAIKFAQDNNIRFVIRNTGHDYIGRSTGAGALSVWTHNLKDIEFKTWNDQYYQGTAVKVGAGVQGFDIMAAGLAQGQVVVGGECPTVGIAGGYTQGGGHSALSTSFGLSADNTLEFEVVIANGSLVTASRTTNADLYWALSGGGGGNYGVVMSMTVKSHPDTYVGGATLAFYASNTPTDTFYAAIDAFHAALPDMVNAGSMVVYYFTNSFFMIAPITAYGKTSDQVQAILAPYIATLDSMNVTYTATYSQSATYYEHYNTYFGPLPTGSIQVGIAQYGGRLVPVSSVTDPKMAASLGNTTRFIAENNVTWIGVGTNVSSFGSATGGAGAQNAVLPAWRNALVHVTLTTVWSFDPAEWDQMLANQGFMTDTIMPAIEAVTPNSGAYMNEADFQQPDFQDVFFGSNYSPLMCIKKKYDPDFFFYARNAVGSETWTVANDGRMCKA